MWNVLFKIVIISGILQTSLGIVQLRETLKQKLADNGVANVFVSIGGAMDICQKAVRDRDVTKATSESTVALIRKLKQHAKETQKPIHDLLHILGIRNFKSFWISNSVYVPRCNAAIVSILQNHDAVTAITEERIFTLDPIAASNTTKVAPSWGIDSVRAQAVWNKGIKGSGVIVATIDSGVRWTHKDLKANYLGLWWDPANNTKEPNDQVGHGTHTMGTIVGSNGIGVAPGAKWLTCKGCQSNVCAESDLVSCGQWIVCPDTEANECKMKPHLCSNSWGGPGLDTFYDSVVICWQAMNILPIFANGNTGPACGSSGSPGRYETVVSVGAFDNTNTLAAFSSRALSSAPDLTFPPVLYKPNVAAPGVAITSAWYTSDVATNTISGTSMATPHVAGVAALVISACPSSGRNINQLKTYLVNGCRKTGLNRPSNVCDVANSGSGTLQFPNNEYGMGAVDALNSVTAAQNGGSCTS